MYFPIYEPDKEDECGLGKAFICARNDECGSNNSHAIDEDGNTAMGNCFELDQRGILSELVIFGDSLFANLAGPSETQDTLIKILAAGEEFTSYRKSWRENF